MSHAFVFPPPAVPSLPVDGSTQRFPIHRVYCIGRNYAEHAREMGVQGDAAAPVFFLKPASAVVELPGDVRYPPATVDLHHEVELVVALKTGGSDIDPERALECVYGYAIGLDLTRRDLQAAAKAKAQPWDTGKSFEHAAPVGPIHPLAQAGHPTHGVIALSVNGEPRQQGDLADMLVPVPAIIVALSRLFTLAPGDLIFTGTPAGVGPLLPGDRFSASIEGLGRLDGELVAR